MLTALYTQKSIVRVPCAIIECEGKIFAAQRNSEASFPLKWEFPGGKAEEGETDEQALVREIMEELSIELHIHMQLAPTQKDQGWREILLVPFVCSLKTNKILLTEHLQSVWISLDEIHILDWTEADLNVIETYKNYLASIK